MYMFFRSLLSNQKEIHYELSGQFVSVDEFLELADSYFKTITEIAESYPQIIELCQVGFNNNSINIINITADSYVAVFDGESKLFKSKGISNALKNYFNI